MKCGDIQKLMYEALDRVLQPDERSLLEAHLSGCADCRSEQVLLKAMIKTVESTPQEMPGKNLAQSVMARLAAPAPSWLHGPTTRRIALSLTFATAFLIWQFRALIASNAKTYLPWESVVRWVSATGERMDEGVQTMIGVLASRLPESVPAWIEWNALLPIVLSLAVGFLLVRIAEAFRNLSALPSRKGS